jgi:hypothetical protein
MPAQALLRLIKRWRRYEPRGEWKYLRPRTRGVYVLYKGKALSRLKSGVRASLRRPSRQTSAVMRSTRAASVDTIQTPRE